MLFYRYINFYKIITNCYMNQTIKEKHSDLAQIQQWGQH